MWQELWYYLLPSYGGIDESMLWRSFLCRVKRMYLTIIYLFIAFGHDRILRALASGSNSSFDLSGEKRNWALPCKESQKYHLYQKAHKHHFVILKKKGNLK